MNYYYDYYYYLTAVKQVNLATNEYFGHDENGTILAIAISPSRGRKKPHNSTFSFESFFFFFFFLFDVLLWLCFETRTEYQSCHRWVRWVSHGNTENLWCGIVQVEMENALLRSRDLRMLDSCEPSRPSKVVHPYKHVGTALVPCLTESKSDCI